LLHEPSNDVSYLQQKVQQLTALLNASISFNSAEDIHEVVERVLEQMVMIVKAEAGTLWLYDEEQELIIPAVVNGPSAEKVKSIRLRKGEGVVGRVIENNHSELVTDVTKDPSWAKRVDEASGFVTRSLMTVPLFAKDIPIGAMQLVNKQGGQLFSEEDLNIALALANQSALAIHNSKMFDQLYRLSMSMIRTLALALDARDPYTAGHSSRVSRYSLWIARELGLSEKECRDLERAALLHDIGKIGVPDHILGKNSRLTDEEYAIMAKHPEIGARILSKLEPQSQMKLATEVARHHHEKMDGTGYPDKISGEQIPFYARIVAVADAFDAMTTDRPYHKGRTYREGIQEVLRCRGTHFDAQVADAFAKVMEKRNYLEQPKDAEES